MVLNIGNKLSCDTYEAVDFTKGNYEVFIFKATEEKYESTVEELPFLQQSCVGCLVFSSPVTISCVYSNTVQTLVTHECHLN